MSNLKLSHPGVKFQIPKPSHRSKRIKDPKPPTFPEICGPKSVHGSIALLKYIKTYKISVKSVGHLIKAC